MLLFSDAPLKLDGLIVVGVLDAAIISLKSLSFRMKLVVLEHRRDLLEAAIDRYRRQAFVERVDLVSRIVCPVFQKVLDEVNVPLSDREMDGRRIVVLPKDQRRIGVDQAFDTLDVSVAAGDKYLPQLGRVSGCISVQIDQQTK